MLHKSFITAGLVLGIAMPALAAQTAPAAPSPAQQAANRDFGKFSAQGFKAFADIQQARLAIFNGDTGLAKKDIRAAAAALDQAKSDGTVFMKAEAELTPPKGTTEPNPGNTQPSTTQVKWLPINGAMTIADDYVGDPQKAAGVGKADTQLKAGHNAQALQTLKLAAVDVSFDEQVAPLDPTISGVNNAEQLADSGKYFEANQALQKVQDGIRFDVQNVSTTPAAAQAHATANSGTTDQAVKTNS
jgi:hypothetical protein